MKARRLLTATIIGFVTIIGLPLMVAPAASAHDAYAAISFCGSNYIQRCGYGGVTNSHTRVYSCDTYGDGYGFRTEYQLASGARGYVDDANGSSSGCSAVWPGSSSNPVRYFRVIWKRSSSWVYSTWYTA